MHPWNLEIAETHSVFSLSVSEFPMSCSADHVYSSFVNVGMLGLLCFVGHVSFLLLNTSGFVCFFFSTFVNLETLSCYDVTETVSVFLSNLCLFLSCFFSPVVPYGMSVSAGAIL